MDDEASAPVPGARIAEAIVRLSSRGIMVEESVDGNAVVYRVTRTAYRATVTVDRTRFIGLDFDLHHFVSLQP